MRTPFRGRRRDPAQRALPADTDLVLVNDRLNTQGHPIPVVPRVVQPIPKQDQHASVLAQLHQLTEDPQPSRGPGHLPQPQNRDRLRLDQFDDPLERLANRGVTVLRGTLTRIIQPSHDDQPSPLRLNVQLPELILDALPRIPQVRRRLPPIQHRRQPSQIAVNRQPSGEPAPRCPHHPHTTNFMW